MLAYIPYMDPMGYDIGSVWKIYKNGRFKPPIDCRSKGKNDWVLYPGTLVLDKPGVAFTDWKTATNLEPWMNSRKYSLWESSMAMEISYL